MPFEQIQGRLKEGGASFLTQDLWIVIRGNLKTVAEAVFWEKVCAGDITPLISDRDYITQALCCLPQEPWDTTTWPQWTGQLKEMTGRKGKELFMPLRQAITGMDHGPEMKDLLPLIGYEKVVKRLG